MLRLVTEVYIGPMVLGFLLTFDNHLETNAHKYCLLHMINEWFVLSCMHRPVQPKSLS
jgi:hypothetical protein